MDDFSCYSCLNASDANRSVALVTDFPNVDIPVKKIAKNYKKKGKSKKKCTDSVELGVVEVANQTCRAPETCTTESASDAAIDHKVILNCNRTWSLTTSTEFHSSSAISFSGANEANCRNASERGFSFFKDSKHDDSCCSRFTSEPDENKESVQASTVSPSLSFCEPMVECLSNTRECAHCMFSEFSSGDKSDAVKGKIFDVLDSVHHNNWISGRSSSETIHAVEGSNSTEKKIISEHMETLFCGNVSQASSYDNKSMMCCTSDMENLVGPKKSSSGDSIYRAKSSNQCSSISVVHEVTPGKRVEHGSKLSQCSNDIEHKRSRAKICNQSGKENSRFIWQKVQKNARNPQVNGEKQLNHNNEQVQMGIGTQEAALPVNHNSLSTGRLLPSPVISSFRRNDFAEEVKEIQNNEQGMYGTHGHVLVESSQRVAQQRFHGNVGQYFSQSRKADIKKNKVLRENSKAKPNQLPKHRNFNHCKKESWFNKENLYRLRNKMNLSEGESLQASSKTYSRIGGTSDKALSHEVVPLMWMNIPRIERASVGSLHASSDNDENRSTCFEIELYYEDNARKDLTSLVGSKKWIPVDRKDSWKLKGNGIVDKPILDSWKPETHQETPSLNHGNTYLNSSTKTEKFSSYDTPTVLRIDSEMPKFDKLGNEGSCTDQSRKDDVPSNSVARNISPLYIGSRKAEKALNEAYRLQIASESVLRIDSEMPKFDKLGNEGSCTDQSRKDDVPSDSVARNISPLYIGSRKAEKALNEAYRLQIASESVQEATGSPLAEFERLLHSASPVIVPVSVPKHCEECSGKQICLKSLCKHQVPDIPLSAIWNWYEEPASYGLEVKAEDSESMNIINTYGISFHAHFVPFLSAVQLFAPSCDSKCNRAGDLISEVPEEKRTAEQCTSPISPEVLCIEVETNPSEIESVPLPFNSAEKPTKSADLLASDRDSSSDDLKLIFEFFESEQPQQRKPLHSKIMELIEAGTSCGQVFGDPSKLKCLNLQDLHPASWYSVAWYPIYRIPEGNLRASFLTYHSLGHLAQRCISNADSLEEKTFCVACPVLGLQSYNTQGECWFYPKKPSGLSSTETTPLNTSDILKERLRTLEEAALLFSRGYVYKDNVKVANRQPDYEFFLSRKH